LGDGATIIQTHQLFYPPDNHRVTLVTLWQPTWGQHFLQLVLDDDPRPRTTAPPPMKVDGDGQWYASLHWFRMAWVDRETGGPGSNGTAGPLQP
jgi:hypothetical protein